MKILIIGAGAVGLVYGRYFADAGHQVTFMVKEKYREGLAQRRDSGEEQLYYLNRDKKLQKPQVFTQFELISDWALAQEADEADGGFDLVVLAISSNALRALPLDLLKQQLHRREHQPATLMMLQPNDTDCQLLSEVIDPQLIVQGMISMISYDAELNNKNGTAYYIPPAPMPISAATDVPENLKRRDDVVKLFSGSGIKAKAVNSALDESRLPSAFLMTFLCVLEAADWRFDQLCGNQSLLEKMAAAQIQLLPQQMTNKTAANIAAKVLPLVLKPWLYRVLLRIFPKVLPLPLEAYLKKHFLKVHDQTRLYMQEYADQSGRDEIAALVHLIS